MTEAEDQIMNFLIHRTAKSFYYINIIGYRYFRSRESITSKQLIHLFTQIIRGFNIERYISSLVFNNEEFSFFLKVLNICLNCIFINDINKLILQKLKNIIEYKNKTYFQSLAKNRIIKK
jgi:hypothetical protein